MNSATTPEAQAATSKHEIDLSPMVSIIMQAMEAFGQPYGMSYIAQFLTADRFLQFRKPTHRFLDGLGKFGNKKPEDIVAILHHLVDMGFAAMTEPEFTMLGLTEAGKDWLKAPQPILVNRRSIRFNDFELYLRHSLKEKRRELAQVTGLPVWQVMTDYTLDRIVLHKPLGLETLVDVPGITPEKCERYGAEVLGVLKEVFEHFEDYKRANLLIRVKKGSYPKVRQYFQEGLTIPDIARACSIKVDTVCSYLVDLHDANLVDIVPWIEENINPKVLFKCTEYFEKVRRGTLGEAHVTLGVDYRTLAFCRLYVRDKQARAAAHAMAS